MRYHFAQNDRRPNDRSRYVSGFTPKMRSNPDNPYSAGSFFGKMEDVMNQDQTKGKFQQLKGKLKETWGRLTDDDISLYEGQRDQFFGKLQAKYGLMREEAETRIREMERAQKAA
jgi:uncharacterized protein YjbJ (UPF0337 family)